MPPHAQASMAEPVVVSFNDSTVQLTSVIDTTTLMHQITCDLYDLSVDLGGKMAMRLRKYSTLAGRHSNLTQKKSSEMLIYCLRSTICSYPITHPMDKSAFLFNVSQSVLPYPKRSQVKKLFPVSYVKHKWNSTRCTIMLEATSCTSCMRLRTQCSVIYRK